MAQLNDAILMSPEVLDQEVDCINEGVMVIPNDIEGSESSGRTSGTEVREQTWANATVVLGNNNCCVLILSFYIYVVCTLWQS